MAPAISFAVERARTAGLEMMQSTLESAAEEAPPHDRRLAVAAGCERAIKIAQLGKVPTGLAVAQQEKRFHLPLVGKFGRGLNARPVRAAILSGNSSL